MGSDTRDPEARLVGLGLVLPPTRQAVGSYLPAVLDQGLLYLSGQGPVDAQGAVYRGKVGSDVTVEQARGHARVTALNLLAAAKTCIGSLSRVRRVVKVLGMVNAVPDFTKHPAVIDGCSDLLVEVFGPEAGAHARSAIGVASLPGQITVEIEMILSIEG